MQVLKWVPPEHKQPKHRGLLPFPMDQICRQRKFLGDNSHHYQARHCTADNHSLLRAEEYTKHPPIRLNGQSNQSPSCSTTAWINGIPCPRQTQKPRHEQTLNLCAQGFPKAGLWKGQLSPGVSGWDLKKPAGHTGPSFSVCSPQPLALSLPQLLQARSDPLPARWVCSTSASRIRLLGPAGVRMPEQERWEGRIGSPCSVNVSKWALRNAKEPLSLIGILL